MQLSGSDDDVTFLRKAIGAGIRLDGRGSDEERGVELQLSRSDRGAVVEVLFGKTRVVCVTRGEIVAPFPDRPNDGFVQFSTNMSVLAEKAGFSDSALSRVLDRAIREADAIDTESLCIVGGEKVWHILCSVHVLDYQGNLTDACVFAAMASLRCFRKPEVSLSREIAPDLAFSLSKTQQDGLRSAKDAGGVLAVSETQVRIFAFDEREPLPLALHHTPLSVTLAAFTNLEVGNSGSKQTQTVLLVDPSLEEEQHCDASLSLCFTSHGDLCGAQKPGKTGLSVETILEGNQLARARARHLHALLHDALANYEKEATKARDQRLMLLRQARTSQQQQQQQQQQQSADGSTLPPTPPTAEAVGLEERLLDFNILHEAAPLRQEE